MNHLSVRRRAFAVTTLSAATLLVACEDKRVKALDTGITRDSAVSIISQDLKPGTPPDSFPNVYKRERYLMNGKTFEVLYYTANNEKQPEVNVINKDTVPLEKLTPI